MFNWFAFLTYAVITAATPGPNNIMSMSNGGRLGFKGALPFNFGILAGFAAVMLICTAFCSTLTELIPAVKTPMLIAGAAYMLHLAWATYKSDGVITEDHSRSGFYSGLILQFINPKIYIYCIMSMQAYILPFYTGEPFKLTLFALLLAYRFYIYAVLVGVWFGIPPFVQPPYQKRQHHYGAAFGLLRRFTVRLLKNPSALRQRDNFLCSYFMHSLMALAIRLTPSTILSSVMLE